MSNPKLFKGLFAIGVSLICLIIFSCSNDDTTENVEVTVNGTVLLEIGDDFNGDIDGDFTGNGGSGSRVFAWQNSLSTADYNADITATSEGQFKMTVKDANNNIVLDRSLRGGTEPDSFSGVTSNGAPGIWSVTITLTSFNGDGSFSLSEGD